MKIVLRLFWVVGIAAMFVTTIAGLSGSAEAAMTADLFRDTSQLCLGCHSSPSSKHFVDQEKFKTSVHGNLSCNTCHLQAMSSFPHQGKATDALQMCSSCHRGISKEYSSSVHGKLFAKGNLESGCNSCHGRVHGVLPSSNPQSPVAHINVAETCGSCHEGEVTESYRHSFHGIANKFGSETTAQCVSCHGSHNILGPDDPASAVAKGNVAAGCAKCHGGEAIANFENGPEHFSEEPGGSGAPMYYTLKFFVWLTIVVVTLLIIHMELELFRKLKETKS